MKKSKLSMILLLILVTICCFTSCDTTSSETLPTIELEQIVPNVGDFQVEFVEANYCKNKASTEDIILITFKVTNCDKFEHSFNWSLIPVIKQEGRECKHIIFTDSLLDVAHSYDTLEDENIPPQETLNITCAFTLTDPITEVTINMKEYGYNKDDTLIELAKVTPNIENPEPYTTIGKMLDRLGYDWKTHEPLLYEYIPDMIECTNIEFEGLVVYKITTVKNSYYVVTYSGGDNEGLIASITTTERDYDSRTILYEHSN